MSRTIKSVQRPDPHVFAEDPGVPADWKGQRFCRCALREDDGVHVTSSELAAELPPVSEDARELQDRILGEAETDNEENA